MIRSFRRWIGGLVAAAVATTVATGCGGGGSDGAGNAAPPSPEGEYAGSLSGTSNDFFQMIVLENNDFWLMYGTVSSNLFAISGFIQGSATTSGTAFNSTSMKDYGPTPPVTGSVGATFDATAGSITGSATFPGGSVGFNSSAATGFLLYNYRTAATLSAVAGNWTVSLSGGDTATLAVGSTGAFTLASARGCAGSGSVVPRASGRNVFDLSLTFGAAPCLLPGATVSGIAIAAPLTNGRTQLIGSARNAAQSNGFLMAGAR